MLISEAERREIRAQALAWATRHGQVEEDCPLKRDIPWRPHLYCRNSDLAVHLLLYPGLERGYLDAFKLAKHRLRHLRIVIVGPVQFIQTPAVLEHGGEVDAQYVVLEDQDGSVKATEYRDVLTLVHQMPLVLPKATYRKLAAEALPQTLASKASEKGRRLESLIAFLFSQVPGFKIISTNYNTATEEIDIVVRNRRVGGIFSAYPEPLILVECKNQVKRASKDEYVAFVAKLRNRRQSATIGFFVSMSGYTQDFRLESLRNSKERFVVAKLGRNHIEKWIEIYGETAGIYIERLVEEAVLE